MGLTSRVTLFRGARSEQPPFPDMNHLGAIREYEYLHAL
jgi:hypothetical protein